MTKILKSHQIGAEIITALDDSKAKCTIVSPYIDLWEHLEDAIKRAKRNGVQIECFMRSPEEKKENEFKQKVDKMTKLGVIVHEVPNLHAKVYRFDDQKAMVGSMNLYNYSQGNSIELILETDDREIAAAIDGFIEQYVRPNAKPEKGRPTVLHSFVKSVVGAANAVSDAIFEKEGHCIRCNTKIPDDIKHPLCDEHYKSWAKYKNPEFSEKFCLGCGKEIKSSYAKPYCPQCYREHR